MKRSTKAALLSALVFPGVGHMYLKKYTSGVILMSASFTGIYLMIAKTIESALQIVAQIQNGSVEPDIAAIMEVVSRQPIETGIGVYLIDIATAVFFICWIIGIIDSYRVGGNQDKIEKMSVAR